MRIFIILALCLFASPALALECNTSGNQMEMNQCALDDFNVADKQLNTVWKALIKENKDNAAYIKQLRVAQRAWIGFRDAEVAAMFACEDENMRICWGSMYPLLYHGVMTELTEQRTKRLKMYLKHGQNPSVGE